MKKKFCPQCGSTNLKLPATPWKTSPGLFFDHYLCQDCGYEGLVVEGDEKFRAELKKKAEAKA